MIKSFMFILLLGSMNFAMAIEKCELPLFFLDEAIHYQVNGNIDEAKANFQTGFKLHQTLLSECGTEQYSSAWIHYLEQYDSTNKPNT